MADDSNKDGTLHLETITTEQDRINKPQIDSKHVKAVVSVELQEAIARSKPKVFTWSVFQLCYFMAVSMMTSWANGYDGSLMSGINAMPQYKKMFGTEMTGGSTGIVFAIYTIGNVVGACFTGTIGDLLGRKWGMWIGALCIAAGACAQGASMNIHGFMGGRFLCGFGIGIGQANGVTYAAEIAHPAWRSAFTAMFNTFYFVGALVVGWVTYATLTIDGNYAWRIPIYLQCFAPAIILFSGPFIPESPRWLMNHDRHDQALAFLAKYHGNGDRQDALVQLEYDEMMKDISLEGSDKTWWDYRCLFNTREARYRLSCVIGMAFIGQWAGNGAVTYYLPAMLDQAGIKSSKEQILYNAILNTLSYPCGLFAAIFIAGRFPRRKVFITAEILFCIEFIIITALTATFSKPQYANNTSGSKAAMAFIFLFRLTYSLTFTPLHPVYPVECFSYETRAKGEGAFTIFDNIASFFNTYVTPIGLGNAKWKFYLLYIIWDAFIPIFIYFVFVETHGRTLEELTAIFRSKNPVKASIAKKKVVVADEGEVVAVLDTNESRA